MRAVSWVGKEKIAVSQAPEPKIQDGEVDPSFVITHRLDLDQADEGYRMFRIRRTNASKS